MYRLLAKILPKNAMEMYKSLMAYSNINIEPNKFVGFLAFSGIGLSLFFAFIISPMIRFPLWILLIIFFFVFEVTIYIILLLRADMKAKFIEDVLPDALQLMSSNLRAGLTVERALILSARPEFGPLQEEINLVGKEITMSKDLGEALSGMSKRIKSDKLEKTMLLIASGLKAGGELASLLDQTANNLRQQKFVDDKVRSNVMMYVIFIFAAIGFGAPLLFGLSSFLVEVLTKSIGELEMPKTAAVNIPISLGKVAVEPRFILIFAVVSMITSSIMGSLVLGLIAKGKEKEGVKFIPVLMAVSLSLFFFVRFLIKSLLGGLFGF